MNPLTSPLLTDLYQLNMIQAYLDHGETKTAVFEFFVRKFPPRRGFLIAAGLEQVLDFLENLRFSPEEIDWLARTHRFDKGLLDRLAGFRFTGDVHAMPEGRVFFANEPILRVTAPMPQAQLAETRLINIVHFQTLIAAKAARMVLAAPGKLLGRFRAAPRARRRSRTHGCPRQLYRRLRGHRDDAGRGGIRHSGLRHDGPFLCRSLRHRDGRLRMLRARAPEESDAAHRHLRHRGGSQEGGRAGAPAGRAWHRDPRGAAGQRRSHRSVEKRAPHPG